MQSAIDQEEVADWMGEGDAEEAAADYWSKAQPALANAFGLIQQAMEMALKARIAAVSPYLLISRDPKDWPKGVDKGPVPFSEFRTLDAADLVKVHNSFAAVPLDDEFRSFWENVRRDRNKIMHSVAAKTFEPAVLIRAVLIAAEVLFSEQRWPSRLLEMEEDGKFAAYGLTEDAQNNVMRQLDVAMRHLEPHERQRFFGFEKRNAYICPKCYYAANRDWQDHFPKLAQLVSQNVGEIQLHCVLCDATVDVERVNCSDKDCKTNVTYEGLCLSCLQDQESG